MSCFNNIGYFVEKFNNVGCYEFALAGGKYRPRYASRRIKSVLWLVCGSILMSAGFVLFMNPYQVVPGGVYGLGIVLHALFPSIQVGTFGLTDIPLLLIGLKVFRADVR